MVIGMILDAPYPEDGRVTKEAIALIDAGHEVHMLCVLKPGQPQSEIVNGIHLYRMSRGLSLFWKTAWDSINALLWRHPKFDKVLPNFIKQRKIEALHVHDLPLAGSTAHAAKKFQIPWVLDLHENYPAGLQIWMEHKTNPVVLLKNLLLMGYKRWVAYEKRMVDEADVVIAVVKEMKDRLIRIHSTPPEKIGIVTNSEWKDFFEQFPSIEEVRNSYPGKFVILYLGYFGPHRGVDTVIEALPKIVKEIPNALFVVVGKGSFQPNLERLAKELSVEQYVDFLGFKPYAQVGSWMKRADINITPHKSNEHTDHTVPHKLFHSLLSGRPTLVSTAPPLARIAKETGGAFVFEAENPTHLSECVQTIYRDKNQVIKKAQSGIEATTTGGYNWDENQLNLVKMYEKLN